MGLWAVVSRRGCCRGQEPGSLEGKKLFSILAVQTRMLLYLSPDGGGGLKSQRERSSLTLGASYVVKDRNETAILFQHSSGPKLEASSH